MMDIATHRGVFRYLREDIESQGRILPSAIFFDAVVPGAFLSLPFQRQSARLRQPFHQNYNFQQAEFSVQRCAQRLT